MLNPASLSRQRFNAETTWAMQRSFWCSASSASSIYPQRYGSQDSEVLFEGWNFWKTLQPIKPLTFNPLLFKQSPHWLIVAIWWDSVDVRFEFIRCSSIFPLLCFCCSCCCFSRSGGMSWSGEGLFRTMETNNSAQHSISHLFWGPAEMWCRWVGTQRSYCTALIYRLLIQSQKGWGWKGLLQVTWHLSCRYCAQVSSPWADPRTSTGAACPAVLRCPHVLSRSEGRVTTTFLFQICLGAWSPCHRGITGSVIQGHEQISWW